MQTLNLSAILNIFLIGGLRDVPYDKDKRYVNIYQHFCLSLKAFYVTVLRRWQFILDVRFGNGMENEIWEVV